MLCVCVREREIVELHDLSLKDLDSNTHAILFLKDTNFTPEHSNLFALSLTQREQL